VGEEKVVRIRHARGIHFTSHERSRRVTLSADVVTMQTHAHVETADAKVHFGRKARGSQMGEGQEGSLR
jgi:hypothetical protein